MTGFTSASGQHYAPGETWCACNRIAEPGPHAWLPDRGCPQLPIQPMGSNFILVPEPDAPHCNYCNGPCTDLAPDSLCSMLRRSAT
jgi:hypothetical protein